MSSKIVFSGNSRTFESVKKEIRKAKTVGVFSHVNPDGDSIGSLLSLGLGLKKLGKRVYMISQDGVPFRYRKLPGARYIVKKTKVLLDAAIAVDCGDKELLGKTYDLFKKAKVTLAIDHHSFRNRFSHISLIDPKAAAVGELIYLFLRALRVPITKDIAQNILTSIIVETNSFRLPETRPLTFQICSQLLKTGLDFYKLTEMVYWSWRRQAVMLSADCIGRTKFLKQAKLAWSIVRKKDLKRFNAKDEDADAVTSDMLSISGVQAVIFFREKSKKLLRVSLRSKGKVNLIKLAKEYNGGGHFDSAGCKIPNDPKVISQMLASAQKLV